MRKQIKSLVELKKESVNGADFFILLNHGLISRKHIWYDEDVKQFEVINMIDGTEQVLSEEEIMDEMLTNIGKAILRGVFYKED